MRHGFEIPYSDKGLGKLRATRASFKLSDADCGFEDSGFGIARLVVFDITFVGEEPTTTVKINSKFTERRMWDNRRWNAPCFSRGRLEKQILESANR